MSVFVLIVMSIPSQIVDVSLFDNWTPEEFQLMLNGRGADIDLETLKRVIVFERCVRNLSMRVSE